MIYGGGGVVRCISTLPAVNYNNENENATGKTSAKRKTGKMETKITREEVEKWCMESQQFKPACKSRFMVSVLPRFHSMTEFYNADLDKMARQMGRKCGKDTLAVCVAAKEYLYQRNAIEVARDKAMEEAKQAEEAKRELEDPFIPAAQIHQLAEMVDLLKLPGIRYRKFLDFVKSVAPDTDLITMKP